MMLVLMRYLLVVTLPSLSGPKALICHKRPPQGPQDQRTGATESYPLVTAQVLFSPFEIVI